MADKEFEDRPRRLRRGGSLTHEEGADDRKEGSPGSQGMSHAVIQYGVSRFGKSRSLDGKIGSHDGSTPILVVPCPSQGPIMDARWIDRIGWACGEGDGTTDFSGR